MDLEIIILSEVSLTMRHQQQMLSLTYGIWKKDRLNLFAEQITDSQTLKNLWFPKETVWGGNVLGLWDGNPIKLDSDDHCTTINVINSLSNKNTIHYNSIKKKKIKVLISFIKETKDIYSWDLLWRSVDSKYVNVLLSVLFHLCACFYASTILLW